MAKKVFITATGTDIGKTYVSALIVKEMRKQNFNCGYFKPVLSGVEIIDNKLVKSDCNYVVDIASIDEKPENTVSYYWEEAISPHLASLRAKETINPSKILADLQVLDKKYDYMLIEGAGGITCPLISNENQQYLLKDLIKDLDCSVIIIADGGLGTINSTLLTIDYAKNHNIKIQGVILNNYDAQNFMHQDNLKQIELLTKEKVIATVAKNQTKIDLLEQYFD